MWVDVQQYMMPEANFFVITQKSLKSSTHILRFKLSGKLLVLYTFVLFHSMFVLQELKVQNT